MLGKPSGMPRGCSEEPLGLFLPSPPAPSGENRGGEAGTGGPQQETPIGMETLWKEPPGGSRAFWTFRSAGKNTQNDPNAGLWVQCAPCHCPQHHCHRAGTRVQGCGLVLPPASSVPSVPGRAVPQGEGTGSWQLHRKWTEQLLTHGKENYFIHSPGGTLLPDPEERGQIRHAKDSINAAFLPHSLWMGNSLLTVPKSYRDPQDINFHIVHTSEPLCSTAPPQPAPPHPPLLWGTQPHLRQYFPLPELLAQSHLH